MIILLTLFYPKRIHTFMQLFSLLLSGKCSLVLCFSSIDLFRCLFLLHEDSSGARIFSSLLIRRLFIMALSLAADPPRPSQSSMHNIWDRLLKRISFCFICNSPWTTSVVLKYVFTHSRESKISKEYWVADYEKWDALCCYVFFLTQ